MRVLPALAAASLLPFFLLSASPVPQDTGGDQAQESAEGEEAEKERPKKPRLRKTEGSLPMEFVDGLDWRSIGPANMGGRVTDIAVHPSDASTYWIGTAGGGVLKTTNRGVTYSHQFTSEGSGSIGALAVATSNPDVLYVGTGEPNPRNSVSWGDGVYRSADGGETWDHVGLDESFQVGAIVVHPDDENTVYVAALGRLWGPNETRGLYKSTDGGEEWEQVLFVDENTGVIDVTLDPADPDFILAATYERRRDIYDSNDPASKWGEGSGLWRSADGGASFERLSDTEGTGAGLPDARMGRIGIDWARSESGTVFAIIETERITQARPDSAYMGVTTVDAGVGVRVTGVTEDSPAAEAGLKEDDVLVRLANQGIVDRADMTEQIRLGSRGETVAVEVVRDGEIVALELTYSAPPEDEEDPTDELGYPRSGPFSIGLGGQRSNQQHLQGPDGKDFGGVYRSDDRGSSWTRVNSLNPRPMYYSQLRVDPSDVNNIYVLGTRLHRSFDAGETFAADGHDGSVHVDHHALWIHPTDGRHMILGNDGGIYVTWDQMETWDHHNHVAIGQFYNVGIDATRDYKVYGGLQDNGSWGGPHRTPAGGPINSDWFRVGGGDGFVVLVDPTDPEQIYYESQNGGMGRWHLGTGDRGFMRPRAPKGETYRWNWNTPFILSNHNPKIYYAAGSHVFRSLDRGNNLRQISSKLTVTDRGAAVALAEGPRDEQRLYVGTDDGALWTTPDGGVTWVDLWTLNGSEEVPEAEADVRPKAVAVGLGPDDPISGKWSAQAKGPGIEGDDQGKFTMELTLAEDGEVTGTLDSAVGSGPLQDGGFDADSGQLALAFVGSSMRLEIEGTLEQSDSGEMILKGTIEGAGGSFQFTFEGKREEGLKKGSDDVEAFTAKTSDESAEAGDEPAAEEDQPKKKKKAKHLDDTIDQLLPGRRYVSEIAASAHNSKRVYVTFDGHRSDDSAPYVFRSDDNGETWTDLRNNLPDHAGSARSILEDPDNEDLLFLGTEFGCYASIDRGESWTRINGDQLPTVAVHDFALHTEANELVAGTHGRSLWVLDVQALRSMNAADVEADAKLYPPKAPVDWSTAPTPGSNGTRGFRGENPSSGAILYYSLDRKAREIALKVEGADGTVLRTFEVSGEKGLHRVVWDLRSAPTESENAGGRRRRRGRRAGPGQYRVVLEVHGERYEQTLRW